MDRNTSGVEGHAQNLQSPGKGVQVLCPAMPRTGTVSMSPYPALSADDLLGFSCDHICEYERLCEQFTEIK